MQYAIFRDVDLPFDQAESKLRDSLKQNGFGVLTEIDVAATLKAKLDVDVEPYRILGACNPPLAHRAISAEPSIGTLLPCNVVLRQEGETITVDFMDPAAVLTLVEREGIVDIAVEVRARLERVRDAVAG